MGSAGFSGSICTGVAYMENSAPVSVMRKRAMPWTETPGAVLYLDLDRFKPVNDELGHHAGDLVLVEVARRLRESVRAGATVARVGGDEFVVVLPDCTTPRPVAARIAEAVQAPIRVEGTQVSVGTSIGFAVFPEVASTLDELLHAADAALYEVKRNGRGGIARARRPVDEGLGRLVHGPLGLGDSGAAGQELPYGLAGAALRLLREMTDGRGRRGQPQLPLLRRAQPGEQAQQRRLARAVGPDQADHISGRDDEVEPAEQGTVTVTGGEVLGDEGGSHRGRS